MNNMDAFLKFGFTKISGCDTVCGSIRTHHIYRERLSSKEGATLAILSSTLDKLLERSEEEATFIVFSCFDRWGKKQVGIFKLVPENLETSYGPETSAPYFRSSVPGILIIRIGGYDWTSLSSLLIGQRNYVRLYNSCY